MPTSRAACARLVPIALNWKPRSCSTRSMSWATTFPSRFFPSSPASCCTRSGTRAPPRPRCAACGKPGAATCSSDRLKSGTDHDFDLALQGAVERLHARYCHALDTDELEQWPNFFTEKGRYRITTAENEARGLPL